MIVFNLTMELDLTSLNFYEVLEMNGGTSEYNLYPLHYVNSIRALTNWLPFFINLEKHAIII